MLVANIVSKIPTMGKTIAHIKSCELLGALQFVTNFG